MYTHGQHTYTCGYTDVHKNYKDAFFRSKLWKMENALNMMDCYAVNNF